MLVWFEFVAADVDILSHFLMIKSEIGASRQRVITFDVKMAEIDHDVEADREVEQTVID